MNIITDYEQAKARLYKEAPGYKPATKEVEELVVIAFRAGYNAAIIDMQTKTKTNENA